MWKDFLSCIFLMFSPLKWKAIINVDKKKFRGIVRKLGGELPYWLESKFLLQCWSQFIFNKWNFGIRVRNQAGRITVFLAPPLLLHSDWLGTLGVPLGSLFSHGHRGHIPWHGKMAASQRWVLLLFLPHWWREMGTDSCSTVKSSVLSAPRTVP